MKLFVKARDPEILLRALNEQGTAFSHVVDADPVEGVYTVEAVYFSASRTIYFVGELDSKQLDVLKAQSFSAKRFKVNPIQGVIEVDQLEE